MIRTRFTYVLLILVFLGGCSSSKNRVGGVLNLDTDLKLNIVTDAHINPDENQRASPVFVRLYELKSTAAFDKADFVDLYERDKEVLGNDLLGKQVLKPLIPNAERTDNLILKSGATHVALYAEFSQYRGSTYKVTFPITLNNVIKNEVTVKISGTNVVIVQK